MDDDVKVGIAKPIGFEDVLGDYEVAEIDNDEPVSWGFKILEKLGEEKWKELTAKMGKPTYVLRKIKEADRYRYTTDYYVVINHITRAEAIVKYGEMSNEVHGPRGGFKSVMFGDKRFKTKHLKS